jgi:thiol:disulfide interchange protein DsbD
MMVIRHDKRRRRAIYSRKVSVSAMLFILMTASTLTAQQDGSKYISASIVAPQISAKKPSVIGIKLLIEDGWHTYWKNPGDSGLPFELEADSASGFVVEELLYPTPKRFDEDGSVTYGYDDSVVLLARIKPVKPITGRLPILTLTAKWLVCKHVCLPGKAVVVFDPNTPTPARLRDDKRTLDRWTARLPQPGVGFNLQNADAVLTQMPKSSEIVVHFHDITEGTITDFYPEDIAGFLIDYSKINLTKDGFRIPMKPTGEPVMQPMKLKGIIKIGTQGYEVELPVKQ